LKFIFEGWMIVGALNGRLECDGKVWDLRDLF
jgi:hypothetical protein